MLKQSIEAQSDSLKNILRFFLIFYRYSLIKNANTGIHLHTAR